MSDDFTTVESYPKGTKIKILRLPDNNPDEGLIGQIFITHELQDRKGCLAYAVTAEAASIIQLLKK